ncbi:cryptochrome/photolyase family protein [Arthrobacter burdickii]|uniref:Deoxyribodipyrimidine photo-lyase n=1 Tax=Arthrobacter burdickii TaxID=3035920 RepID=A0ABT8K0P6_9MICC|nr:deoxyribodipyrimidine photo-lyase [Arthrobacter burdickii]MDN4611003.1 deoxyribodipyrimidine photo-lyase [Arthrobacter burdickii]
MAVTLVWFRDDLRISDNPALAAAADSGDDVVACYVLDEDTEGIRPLGGASKWWLHHSLAALSASLTDLGIPLVLRRGAAADVVPRVVAESSAHAVAWNRRYGLAERTTDAALKASLADQGVEATSYQANLMYEPWEVTSGTGGAYKVFTPFWRACLASRTPRKPLPAPDSLHGPQLPSDDLDALGLLPSPDWAQGLRDTWTPGEAGAHARLDDFLDRARGYKDNRNLPGVKGTSMLSPHLRFGEISPFEVWHAAQDSRDPSTAEDIRVFGSELGWREFSWQLLYFHPELATVNYRPEFNAFTWETSTRSELEAWQRGQTGYPLIDAGMRQMWEIGWMHNRVRMATASFLIKNLMIDWRVGEKWFWDCLVDADAASNAASWQWVAGSGADASPYFRIFNPVLQSKKFDPDGKYLVRFVPELADADNVHEPWKGAAPGYPEPVVDLKESRERALSAYKALSES